MRRKSGPTTTIGLSAMPIPSRSRCDVTAHRTCTVRRQIDDVVDECLSMQGTQPMMPGRIDVDAAPEHLPAKRVHHPAVEPRRLPVVGDLRGRIKPEVEGEARPHALDPHRKPYVFECPP